MRLCDLQREVGVWSLHNFGAEPAYRKLLGVGEELGELCHAHLKGEQGIRGFSAETKSAKEDAIGDLIIYLADYCDKSGIDLDHAVEKTWALVSQRDWKQHPKDGISE